MMNKILCTLNTDALRPTEREKRLMQDLFDWQEGSKKSLKNHILGQPVGVRPEFCKGKTK